MTTLRRRIAFTAFLVCVPFVLLALLEGTISLGRFALALGDRRFSFGEASHTERDTLVGWINKPNLSRPNQYGRGKSLRTNAQRFRHDGDVAPSAPPGRRRAVCSGDSFTYGDEVGDAETWCAMLAAADTTLETINMGQVAYGIDQAYLWYLRDGLSLHANVHLFAFIFADFGRMESNRFTGFPKPQLSLADGEHGGVRATNVPVPTPGMGPLVARLGRASATLNTVHLLNAISSRITRAQPGPRDSLTWEVAHAALRDLARRDSAAGTTLVVVYLPAAEDFTTPMSRRYRRWLHDAAERNEFQYVDLIEPFHRVAGDSVASLFIGGVGHYTPAGNAWVARQLRERIPALSGSRGVALTTRSK